METLFEIISNFFRDYIFYAPTNDSILDTTIPSLGNLTLNKWLCDICTIAVLIWLVICCFLFVRWIFRLFAGLLKG